MIPEEKPALIVWRMMVLSVPFEDYQEHPEFDWSDALYTLLQRARFLLREHEVIVIEGYFLPGSPGRCRLINDMRVAGAQMEFREFWSPFEVCQGWISAQWEVAVCCLPHLCKCTSTCLFPRKQYNRREGGH